MPKIGAEHLFIVYEPILHLANQKVTPGNVLVHDRW